MAILGSNGYRDHKDEGEFFRWKGENRTQAEVLRVCNEEDLFKGEGRVEHVAGG